MIDADVRGGDCLICAKHRGTGPLVGPTVWADDRLVVSHRRVGEDHRGFLGYLFVETRRHVGYLDQLTDPEAAGVGRAVHRAARALKAELPAEFVFSMIVGTGVAHFHQHVFPRYPHTPRHYDWAHSHDWPDAPHGNSDDITDLCTRLHPHFDAPD